MATVEGQEGNCRQFNLDDVLKNLNETKGDVSESSPSPDGSEDVSIFCKACLNPYNGVSRSGTIVLKCERCGQTDVVLEEKAVEMDLEEWSGNLIMNRFLQVLKEQEDLQLNIIDPNFADDEFKHLTQALEEYTLNMKGIAEQMYDIARQTRLECETLTGVSRGYDADELNCEENPDARDDIDSSSAGKAILDTNFVNADKREGPKTDNDSKGGQSHWMPISTKDRLRGLGATVTKMMKSVIVKYNLSPDIMVKVKERIRHPSNFGAKDVEAPVENEAGVPSNNCVNSINETDDDTMSCDDTSDLKLTNSGTDGDNLNTDQAVDRTDEGQIIEKKLKDDDEDGVEEIDEEDKAENTSILVFQKEEIEQEVFGVLQSKLSIKFDLAKNEQLELVENCAGKMDKLGDTVTKGIEDLQNDILCKPDSMKGASNSMVNDIDKSDNDTSEANGTEVKPDDGNDDDGNVDDDNDEDDDDDNMQVNFCTVSSAFMNELQSRKQKALMERKDKALQTVHQKIVALKQEVERVENRVHEELTMAYQRKMKKVENQRKQLDKRHETIQNVEELMTHYAETGQNDKLAELMAQLDIQYEN